MDHRALAQLIEISHAVGECRAYVQAGGGNTSVKAADGRTMLVKSSGTALSAMSESAGWTALDLGRLLTVLERNELAALDAAQREARVLEHLYSAVTEGHGRPSVESALHALLGRVVIHTHPVAVNALTCGPGERALGEISASNEPPPLWIPYCDPGWKLALAIRSALRDYKERRGQPATVLFLENHGLFVCAEDAQECLTLHAEWVSRCEKYFAATAAPIGTPPRPEAAQLQRAMGELRCAWQKARGATPAVRFSDDAELAGAACNGGAEVLASGALTPDVIVYTGAHAVVVDSLDRLAQLTTAFQASAPPRIVVVRDKGTFLLADDAQRLDTVEEVASSAARIVRLAAGRGGAHNLSPASADFIIHWEAEHYRARL